MTTTSIGSSDTNGIEKINELIAEYKLVAIFVGVELFFVLGGLAADMVTIRIEESGPALSHIVAGLMGGFAVVWILLGVVTYGVVAASNLYMRYQREM